MSTLHFHARPWVAFDAHNAEHRQHYADFLKFNTWGRCPVRFVMADEQGTDLPTLMRNRLVEYYVQVEFRERKAPKARRAIG